MGCADLFCAPLGSREEIGKRSEERERRGEFGLSFFPQTFFSLRLGCAGISRPDLIG
jgi:hypothetical protein